MSSELTDGILAIDLYAGEGAWVAVSACVDAPRGRRHETLADALVQVEAWDSYGCGQGCRNSASRHRAVRDRAAGASRDLAASKARHPSQVDPC